VISPVYSNPLQFAASITADFVRACAPQLSRPASTLDVGCGDGLIASELIKSGFDVLAIDGNPESVVRAREIGVNADNCLLLDFDHAPFDLVMVSRALHHMPSLVESLKKLDQLIKAEGRLIIEDFGFELIDCIAAGWLIEKVKAIKEEVKVPDPRHKWLWSADTLTAEEARVLWQEHHWIKHQLLTAEQMKTGLERQFKVESCQAGAYLFRYLCDLLPSTADGAKMARQTWQEETDLIAEGKLPPVGLRMILQKK
jgi:2-polyprenyl-3-methyl-5-hydroxy-6-metoxy-1,4-benzoquinol methylase